MLAMTFKEGLVLVGIIIFGGFVLSFMLGLLYHVIFGVVWICQRFKKSVDKGN